MIKIRIQNYSKSEKNHILTHNASAKVRSKLKNVDAERTKLNYNLCPRDNVAEYCNKRFEASKHSNQKKTTVLTDIVITLPKEVEEKNARKFFESCFLFLSERYKKENCCSCWVHMDEKGVEIEGEGRFHMHYSMLPINEEGRCSARSIFSREELKQVHIDLQKYLNDNLEFSAPVLNGATSGGNKTIQELKAETKKQQNEELEKQINQEKQIYNFLKSENERLKEFLMTSEEKKQLLKENEQLKEQLKNSVSKKQYNELYEFMEYAEQLEEFIYKEKMEDKFINWQNKKEKIKNIENEKGLFE